MNVAHNKLPALPLIVSHRRSIHCGSQALCIYWVQVAAGFKVFTGDASDCRQMLRHVIYHRVSVPTWRRTRPSLLVEDAVFRPAESTADPSAGGTLLLRCSPASPSPAWPHQGTHRDCRSVCCVVELPRSQATTLLKFWLTTR